MFLTSKRAQQIIKNFRIEGFDDTPVFFPVNGRKNEQKGKKTSGYSGYFGQQPGPPFQHENNQYPQRPGAGHQ